MVVRGTEDEHATNLSGGWLMRKVLEGISGGRAGIRISSVSAQDQGLLCECLRHRPSERKEQIEGETYGQMIARAG